MTTPVTGTSIYTTTITRENGSFVISVENNEVWVTLPNGDRYEISFYEGSGFASKTPAGSDRSYSLD